MGKIFSDNFRNKNINIRVSNIILLFQDNERGMWKGTEERVIILII